MEYFLMTVAVLFSVLSNMILHKFRNRSFKTTGDVFLFNAGISVVWFFVLLVWSLIEGNFTISLNAVTYGIIYGIILCLFLYFKTQSMSKGPVALTSLIGNCAFIIATWFGIIYAKESVLTIQIIGMAIIVAALVMCINPKKSAVRLTSKWYIWCAAFFLAGGLLGIFNKVFGMSDTAEQINTVMLVASVVSFTIFTLMGYSINFAQKQDKPKIYRESLIYIISCGIVGCIYIRMNLWIAGVIPSVIFFPVSNGANVLLSTIFGRLVFGEKLNIIQIFGVLIGLCAIIMIGCPQLIVR